MAKTKNAKPTTERRITKDRRSESERRTQDVPVAADARKSERRNKAPRRRQIDPTTCERDYSADEIEFMHALDEYKRANGRMFPTCSEILEVIRGLGYERIVPPLMEPSTVTTDAPMDTVTHGSTEAPPAIASSEYSDMPFEDLEETIDTEADE